MPDAPRSTSCARFGILPARIIGPNTSHVAPSHPIIRQRRHIAGTSRADESAACAREPDKQLPKLDVGGSSAARAQEFDGEPEL